MRTRLLGGVGGGRVILPPTRLAALRVLRDGSFEMTRQQFRNALKRSIGASKDYADGCWVPFQDSPMHYICSRTDEAQSLELVRLCMELGAANHLLTRRFALIIRYYGSFRAVSP